LHISSDYGNSTVTYLLNNSKRGAIALSNSQYNQNDTTEEVSREKLPYKAPQLKEISLWQGREVLGSCKAGPTAPCAPGGVPINSLSPS
jgi:hypothetical protein